MVCGNIAGNISDPLHITFYTTESTARTPNDSFHSTENQGTHNSSTTEIMGINNSATSRVYIISFSCLATALFVGAVASLTVIAIFLKKSQVKNRTASNRAEETTQNESVYENATLSPLPSASAINTQDNVAYGHTRTSTRGEGATQDVPTYQNDTGPLPPVCVISTQDNVAYGHTKTSIGATQDVLAYEEVTDPISLVSTINTQDNVAYGSTHTITIVK